MIAEDFLAYLQKLIDGGDLVVIHEEGQHEIPLNIEVLPSGEVAIWIE